MYPAMDSLHNTHLPRKVCFPAVYNSVNNSTKWLYSALKCALEVVVTAESSVLTTDLSSVHPCIGSTFSNTPLYGVSSVLFTVPIENITC